MGSLTESRHVYSSAQKNQGQISEWPAISDKRSDSCANTVTAIPKIAQNHGDATARFAKQS
jgi:hypothetical protein